MTLVIDSLRFHLNIKDGDFFGLIKVIRKNAVIFHAFYRYEAENFYIINLKLQVQLAISKPIKQNYNEYQLDYHKVEINLWTVFYFLVIYQPQFQHF